MSISKIKTSLKKKSSKKRKAINESFFKTNKGDYADYDQFIGVSMPDIRKVAKEHHSIKEITIKELLYSDIHEERMLALIILINRYKKQKDQIYNFYIENITQINNWELVDVSCHSILGNYIYTKNLDPIKNLEKFYTSKSIWERRISIVSTLCLIKNDILKPTVYISKKLLSDKEDLVHKAVGWMLREVWKKDQKIIEDFIINNYKKINRTTLRYTIEKMDDKKRKKILSMKY